MYLDVAEYIDQATLMGYGFVPRASGPGIQPSNLQSNPLPYEPPPPPPRPSPPYGPRVPSTTVPPTPPVPAPPFGPIIPSGMVPPPTTTPPGLVQLRTATGQFGPVINLPSYVPDLTVDQWRAIAASLDSQAQRAIAEAAASGLQVAPVASVPVIGPVPDLLPLLPRANPARVQQRLFANPSGTPQPNVSYVLNLAGEQITIIRNPTNVQIQAMMQQSGLQVVKSLSFQGNTYVWPIGAVHHGDVYTALGLSYYEAESGFIYFGDLGRVIETTNIMTVPDQAFMRPVPMQPPPPPPTAAQLAEAQAAEARANELLRRAMGGAPLDVPVTGTASGAAATATDAALAENIATRVSSRVSALLRFAGRTGLFLGRAALHVGNVQLITEVASVADFDILLERDLHYWPRLRLVLNPNFGRLDLALAPIVHAVDEVIPYELTWDDRQFGDPLPTGLQIQQNTWFNWFVSVWVPNRLGIETPTYLPGVGNNFPGRDQPRPLNSAQLTRLETDLVDYLIFLQRDRVANALAIERQIDAIQRIHARIEELQRVVAPPPSPAAQELINRLTLLQNRSNLPPQTPVQVLQSLQWPGGRVESVRPVFTQQFHYLESTTMTMIKGTVDYNSPGWGGWSESVYSDVPTDTLASMLTKMKTWITYRMLLSYGPAGPQCSNPVVPYAIRVEDELVQRDSLVQYFIQPGGPPVAGAIAIPPGYETIYNSTTIAAYNQNLDIELGARVKFIGAGNGQVATPMFHGMPIGGLATQGPGGGSLFNRNSAPTTQWLTQLSNLVSQMCQLGLGFRNIAGIFNVNNAAGPAAAPAAWYYNPTLEMVELLWSATQFPGQIITPPGFPTVPGVLPFPPASPASIAPQFPPSWPIVNSKCRLQIRGWKQFAVLNGRWTAQVVVPTVMGGGAPNPYVPAPASSYSWALRILRRVRMPTDGSVPFVSPIAWNLWWPGENFFAGNPSVIPVSGPSFPPTPNPTPYNNYADFLAGVAQYQYIESKKLGRFRGAERGRARNRAS